MVRYKVTLITSAQPSSNPRLVKEAKSLLNAGFSVTVIWCPISPWADQFDKQLFEDYREINWVNAGYHSYSNPLAFLYVRFRQKIWQIIYKIIGNQFDAAIKSLVLYSQELTNVALQHKADLLIGHNLGALPAIAKASIKYSIKSIFDFEDYHRGEEDEKSFHIKRVIDVEDTYIPLITSITTASPLISNTYKQIFTQKLITTINNCFPYAYAEENITKIPLKPLKLFWFSQYIGKKRGLEVIIQAMSFFSTNDVTLTLLGTSTTEVQNYFYEIVDNLKISRQQILFLPAVAENEIFQIASEHHIGLSSEYTHILNRDLCLTNKVFTYLLAGNALVLSDTNAQKSFLFENPGVGSLYQQNNINELTFILKSYLVNPQLLLLHRKNALDLAKNKYNWDVEQHKFLDNVNYVLAS